MTSLYNFDINSDYVNRIKNSYQIVKKILNEFKNNKVKFVGHNNAGQLVEKMSDKTISELFEVDNRFVDRHYERIKILKYNYIIHSLIISDVYMMKPFNKTTIQLNYIDTLGMPFNHQHSITPTVAEWILKNIKSNDQSVNGGIFNKLIVGLQGENRTLHSISSTEINCKKIYLQYIMDEHETMRPHPTFLLSPEYKYMVCSELLEMLEKLTEKYYICQKINYQKLEFIEKTINQFF